MLDGINEAAVEVAIKPPLQVGDMVLVQTDVLAEMARHAPGLPPTWLMLPAGTEGKVLGYRDRAGEAYAIVEIERKVVMFVREQRLACAPRKPAPQQGRRRRPGIRHRG